MSHEFEHIYPLVSCGFEPDFFRFVYFAICATSNSIRSSSFLGRALELLTWIWWTTITMIMAKTTTTILPRLLRLCLLEASTWSSSETITCKSSTDNCVIRYLGLAMSHEEPTYAPWWDEIWTYWSQYHSCFYTWERGGDQ